MVFNASDIADGAAMAYASTFFDHFHEAHGTSDAQTRPVIVFRRLGTVMALNDMLWEKYAIGEDRKINDSSTHAPAKRNVFWKAAPGAWTKLMSRSFFPRAVRRGRSSQKGSEKRMAIFMTGPACGASAGKDPGALAGLRGQDVAHAFWPFWTASFFFSRVTARGKSA